MPSPPEPGKPNPGGAAPAQSSSTSSPPHPTQRPKKQQQQQKGAADEEPATALAQGVVESTFMQSDAGAPTPAATVAASDSTEDWIPGTVQDIFALSGTHADHPSAKPVTEELLSLFTTRASDDPLPVLQVLRNRGKAWEYALTHLDSPTPSARTLLERFPLTNNPLLAALAAHRMVMKAKKTKKPAAAKTKSPTKLRKNLHLKHTNPEATILADSALDMDPVKLLGTCALHCRLGFNGER